MKKFLKKLIKISLQKSRLFRRLFLRAIRARPLYFTITFTRTFLPFCKTNSLSGTGMFSSVTFSSFTATPPCAISLRASPFDLHTPHSTMASTTVCAPSAIFSRSSPSPPANAAFACCRAVSAFSSPCTSFVSS